MEHLYACDATMEDINTSPEKVAEFRYECHKFNFKIRLEQLLRGEGDTDDFTELEADLGYAGLTFADLKVDDKIVAEARQKCIQNYLIGCVRKAYQNEQTIRDLLVTQQYLLLLINGGNFTPEQLGTTKAALDEPAYLPSLAEKPETAPKSGEL